MSEQSSGSPNPSLERLRRDHALFIRAAGKNVLDDIARHTGLTLAQVLRTGYCDAVTRDMIPTLEANGIQVVRRRIETPASSVAPFHYIVYEPETELYGDPTWAQFLDEGVSPDDMRDVLVGTIEEMQDRVADLPVEQPYRDMWYDQQVLTMAQQL